MSEKIKDCRWPWNRLYVHVNGDIKPCCYATASIGNILNGDDLEKVWRGAEMNELRNYIKENRIHRVCAGSGCSFIRSQMPLKEDFDRQVKYKALVSGYVPDHTLALAKLGQPDALYNYGAALLDKSLTGVKSKLDLLRRGKDIFYSLYLLHKASEGGQANAAYTIAMLLYCSNNIIYRSLRRPRLEHYAKRATELGIPGSNVLLGMMYLNNKGVRTSAKLAEIEFMKAAESGEGMGYLMAGRVAESYGNRDEEARQLYKLAERRGEKEATELLAKLSFKKPV